MDPMNGAIQKTDDDLSDIDGFDIMKAMCPINKKLVDLLKFVFVDDVLRMFAFNTMSELAHRHSKVDESFTARVGDIGVRQKSSETSQHGVACRTRLTSCSSSFLSASRFRDAQPQQHLSISWT